MSDTRLPRTLFGHPVIVSKDVPTTPDITVRVMTKEDALKVMIAVAESRRRFREWCAREDAEEQS